MPIALPPIPTHPTALGISPAHSALPAASGDGRQAVKRSRKRLHCAEVVERSSRRSASRPFFCASPVYVKSARKGGSSRRRALNIYPSSETAHSSNHDPDAMT